MEQLGLGGDGGEGQHFWRHLCPASAMFVGRRVLHFLFPQLPGSLCSPTASSLQPHCSSQTFATAERPAQLLKAAGELGGGEVEKENSP